MRLVNPPSHRDRVPAHDFAKRSNTWHRNDERRRRRCLVIAQQQQVPPLSQLEQLSDLKEIEAMLARIERRRVELDSELRQCAATAGHFDAKMRLIEQHAINIQPAHDEATTLAAQVAQTAALAENVSSKVRLLDRTKARLQETTKKVEDIIDLKQCIEGVAHAMEESDFETAASHVSRFLALDESILDPKSTELLRAAEQRLKSVVRVNLTAAVAAHDRAAINRFAKLFAPLGIADEGAELYADHLRQRWRVSADAIVAADADGGTPVNVATQLFESVAQLIEDESAAVERSFGAAGMVIVLKALQDESDVYGTRVLDKFADDFHFNSTVKAVSKAAAAAAAAARSDGGSSAATAAAGDARVDLVHLGLLLDELALLSQCCETFDRFLRNKAKGFMARDPKLASRSRTADGLLHISALNRRSQELIGGYVALEHCFMRGSMHRAMRMYDETRQQRSAAAAAAAAVVTAAAGVTGGGGGGGGGDSAASDTASAAAEEGAKAAASLRELVDLVFVVAQRCSSRALDSANPSCVCAIVNHVNAFLASELLTRLRPRSAASSSSSTASLRRLINDNNSPAVIADECASLNALALAARHARQMRSEVAARATLTLDSSAPMALLATCLAEVDSTAALYDKELLQFLHARAAALLPRATACLERYGSLRHVAEGGGDDLHQATLSEATRSWAADSIDKLRLLVAPLQQALEPASFETFVRQLVELFCNAFEQQVLQKQFDPLGASQLDNDVRALSEFWQSLTRRSLRDKQARLTQLANVLNLEKPADLLEFWGENSGNLTWRLTPAEVRRVLNLRVDFKKNQIAQLKL
jgi:hypothetical protein